LAAAGVLAVTGLFLSARADEEKVPLDKLPRAVVGAVKKRFPAAKMVAGSKETEEGKTLYEVGLENNGQKVDVTVTAEGQIQEIEQTVAGNDLPRPVAGALNGKYPGAKIQKAESITKVKGGDEKLESYEVVLATASGKKVEVVLSPDGKITKTEEKGKKEGAQKKASSSKKE
jgi:hypothetical protein